MIALDTSAPAVADGDRVLTVSVGFDPASCEFVATRAADGQFQKVFAGPSLTLACSAANQALEDLAPLETLIRAPEPGEYRRTRPQYQQEVRFSKASERMAGLDDGPGPQLRPRIRARQQ